MKKLRTTDLTTDDATLPALTEGIELRQGEITFYPTAMATYTVIFLVDGKWRKCEPITTEDPFRVTLDRTARVSFTASGVTQPTNLEV